MRSVKDMTKREFEAACERRGFYPQGWLGYFQITGEPGRGGLRVSVHNAPRSTRRAKLAYLIQQRKAWEAKQDCYAEVNK